MLRLATRPSGRAPGELGALLTGALLVVTGCGSSEPRAPRGGPGKGSPQPAKRAAADASPTLAMAPGHAGTAAAMRPRDAGIVRDAAAARPTRKSSRIAPLTKAELAVMRAIRGERIRPVKGMHYYTSNETRYDLFYRFVAGIGGAHIGVAADHNYTFAALARAQLVALVDFDPEIVRLHRIYLALTRAADTPEALLELLRPRHSGKKVRALLRAHYPGRAARLYRTYRRAAPRCRSYFLSRAKRSAAVGGRFWLTDAKLYRYWRALVRAERVWVFPGDLTRGRALTDIGRALRTLKIPLRTLYLSNAEVFWKYGPRFRKAILSLPFDERSVILRTLNLGKKNKIGYRWHYAVQRAVDFMAWMRRPGWLVVFEIAKYRRPIDGKRYLSRFPGPDAVGKRRRRKPPEKAAR